MKDFEILAQQWEDAILTTEDTLLIVGGDSICGTNGNNCQCNSNNCSCYGGSDNCNCIKSLSTGNNCRCIRKQTGETDPFNPNPNP